MSSFEPVGPPGFREPTLGQRFLGGVIDGLVLVVPSLVVTVLLGDGGRAAPLANLLVGSAYYVGMHARRSQTVGKMAMGTMLVTRDEGTRVDLGTAAVRWLAVAAIPALMVAVSPTAPTGLWVLVVLLPILRPPLHQGLHDVAARTVVTSVR
jgi:uncharacterized RDD family membrane protein YckC